ncbi:FAR1 DNA binding domain, zinc finger, SWIM-type, MULE transposase domain containing protein [Tanacetum coccineum]|uniref:FAR1 DNA binding domain, zinc finger, SWIM-type, MULE transposase domain containing protein n=1 Tax=Tanacetum coccineum TaxID=301880 RepID=A0ABQ5H6G8_9ASTR
MSIESSSITECSSSSVSNSYDKKAGFDVRRGGEYKAVGFIDATTKYFHCSKEDFLPNTKEKSSVNSLDVDILEHSEVSDGFERFKDPKKKQTKRKPTFRCGCLASLTIKRIGNVFEVTSLIEGHNHPLVAEKDMIFMKNSRNIGYTKQHFLYQVSNANFGPAIGFRLMKQIHGGFDMVGVTVNDCKNQKKKISVFIGDRDAQMAVEKLLSRKLHSPGFYANYYKDCWSLTTKRLLKQFTRSLLEGSESVLSMTKDPQLKIAIANALPDTRQTLYDGTSMMEEFGHNTPKTKKVDFCKSEVKLHCSYNRYEAYGLLCRHAFYVLRMNNVKEFPKNYLHKRWLKNVKPSSFGRRRITGASDVVQSDVLELYQIFEYTIDRLVHDLDKLHIYKDKMKELLNQAEIDVPTVPKVSSKAVMSAMLGVDEPENVLIGNPNLSKVKGTGCFSRMKPIAEVTAKELGKRRTCSACGGKEGHNKRTCINEPASKKPKVQASPQEKLLQSNKLLSLEDLG